MKKNEKVVRLHPDEVEDVLQGLLDDNEKKNLDGLILIATTKDNDLHRYFMHKDKRCLEILGMIEYLKWYINEYIMEQEDLEDYKAFKAGYDGEGEE